MEPNQNMMGEQGADNTNNVSGMSASDMGGVPEMPNMMTSGISSNEKLAKEKKSGKGMLIGMILLGLVAVCGVGFGVWAMMDGWSQKDTLSAQVDSLKAQNSEFLEQLSEVTTDDGGTIIDIDTDDNNDIDIALAQNLIAPYIDSFNYLSNIFDYDFTEDVKAEITYQNLRPTNITTDSVYYGTFNTEYKELFGGDLAKRDYGIGHSDSFTFNDDNGIERFKITSYAGGGAGLGMFSVVKNAYYNNSNLVVNVYHDVIGICGAADDDYCIESNGSGIVVNSIEQSNVKELISNFENKIPVYQMDFSKSGGHYILNSVKKNG